MNLSPELAAFHGGKSFQAIGEDFGQLHDAGRVISADVLDAWFDASPRVLRKLRDFLPFLAKSSPPVHAGGLIKAIANARGLAGDCILAAGGSSDLIFACFPHLIGASSKAVILDPMYGEYHYVLSSVMNVELLPFELDSAAEFQIDTSAFITGVRRERPDLVVIVNPNSPTGQVWAHREALRFLNEIPPSTKVVIDETYLEYMEKPTSMEREACGRMNLIVLKSMSKVYGLSGLRVGYLVAHPSTVRSLAKWIPPWAVSLPAQVAAIEALSDPFYYAQQYSLTRSLREELADRIRKNPLLRVYPSVANFLLIETQSSARIMLENMERSNVFVRHCDSMSARFADRFLRIAVKSRGENLRIAEAIHTAANEAAMLDKHSGAS